MQVAAKMEKTTLQRARGAIDLVIVSGKLKRFYQSGSAKIFIPKTYAKTTEAVLVNTAGGLTGGDIFAGRARLVGIRGARRKTRAILSLRMAGLFMTRMIIRMICHFGRRRWKSRI